VKVLITGSTGYVGSWTAKAVQEAGHETRLFVRDVAKAQRFAEAVGFRVEEIALGDVMDADAVAAALDGCDAVIHAAASVQVAQTTTGANQNNATSARIVLGQAAERGLDPIIYISSTVAVWTPGDPIITADRVALRTVDSYSESKVEAELYARELQDAGVPVVITYPAGILGPAANGHLGEAGDAMATAVNIGMIPGRTSAFNITDVRDLADVHAALLTPGRGPRRYVVAPTRATAAELAAALEAGSGKRVRHVKVPSAALIGAGRAADALRRFLPERLSTLNAGAMTHLTRTPPADSSAAERDLGITFRPLEETTSALGVELRRRAGTP
jgi:nucleoside-diphosphate-sugar epimerase